MIRLLQKTMPPVYVVIFVLIMVLVQLNAPASWLLIPEPLNWIGALAILVALLIIARSAWQFKIAETPLRPFTETTMLVTDGLFRYSRNPIYLALILLLTGEAILLRNPVLLIIPAVFTLIIRQAFILKEEEILKNKFPEQYADYCRKVRRWI